ncbi:MAG: hypothetical protein WBN39_04850 [Flavobacteriaceae bacterium]
MQRIPAVCRVQQQMRYFLHFKSTRSINFILHSNDLYWKRSRLTIVNVGN